MRLCSGASGVFCLSPPAAVAPLISDTVEALWAKPLSADRSRIVAGDWLMTLMRRVSVPTLVAVVPVLMALANPVEGAVIVTLFAIRRLFVAARPTPSRPAPLGRLMPSCWGPSSAERFSSTAPPGDPPREHVAAPSTSNNNAP